MIKFGKAAFETLAEIGSRFVFNVAELGADYHNVGLSGQTIPGAGRLVLLQGNYVEGAKSKPIAFQVYYGYAVEVRREDGKLIGKFAHKRGEQGYTWSQPTGVPTLKESEARAFVELANEACEGAGVEYKEWLVNPVTVNAIMALRKSDPIRNAFGAKLGDEANSRYQAVRLANGLAPATLAELEAARTQAKADFAAAQEAKRAGNTMGREATPVVSDDEIPF